MKKIFLLLALTITTIACAQARHTRGVIIGDPIGTSSDPTGVNPGHIYWNDTLKKFRKFDGTAWSDLSVVAVSDLQAVTDAGATTTNNIDLSSASAISLDVQNTTTNITSSLFSDKLIFNREGYNLTLQSPTLTASHVIDFQDGPGTVAYLGDVGETNIVETIVSPVDSYFGTRVQPKGTTDGYYVNATEDKSTGYLVKSNNNTGTGHYAGFVIEGYGGTPFDNELNLSLYGQNYYAPYLQNNSALYFTGDLKVIGAKNTSDISFRLGNSGTAEPLESSSDEVLTLASNRTITAPELTNTLISTGGNQSLVTKNYVDTNFASAPLDTAYGVSWDGDTTNSASRNSIYDKIEAVILAGGGESTTVSDTSEIDLTLTGNDITASIVASSIDETKLDFSTNASLDKADTALQAEVDGSVTNEIQTIDVSNLSGTVLNLSLSNDGQATKTIELSSLQDGTGTDDQTASEVTSTPSGNLAASDVQTALNELQTDIDTRSVGAHTTDTNTLGSDGDKGDVTVGGSGTTLTIDSGSVNSTKILNGTIAEIDLNTSVNASLDLADSALQSSDIANFETTSQLNTRDTNNRARANHTGTQLASTISDFNSSVQAISINNLAEDSTPQLVANLDSQGFKVTGLGGITFPNFGIKQTTNAFSFDGYSPDAMKFDVGSSANVVVSTFKDNWIFNKPIEATSLSKTGGTSTEFLKADGSVDTSTYLTSFDITTQTDPKYLRSDTDDSTNGGVKTWFGGEITGQSGSGARIQVNGFQRTGPIYLHSHTANVPDATRVADYLENNSNGDLFWNKNGVGSGKVWHSLNDGTGSTLDADLLDGVEGSSYLRSDASDTKTSGKLIFSDDVKFQMGTTSTGTDGGLEIQAGAGTSVTFDLGRTDIVIRDQSNSHAVGHTFSANGDYSATGNVGIGTTTPAYPLDVVGNIQTSGTVLTNALQTDNSTVLTNYFDNAYFYALTGNDILLGGGPGNMQNDVTIGNGNLTISNGNTTSDSFIKDGGTAQQQLLADGTVRTMPKVYTALISQTGTSAPTVTILENTLGGTITWTRDSQGTYTGTLTSAFTNLKTWCSITAGANVESHHFLSRATANTVTLSTVSSVGLGDGLLSEESIEIRVYP